MKYHPNPQQARWLRLWKLTGRPLQGEASVSTQAEFVAMQVTNTARFAEWANDVSMRLSLACGADIKPAVEEKRTRKPRQEKASKHATEIETQNPFDGITPGDDMELYTREHGDDADK